MRTPLATLQTFAALGALAIVIAAAGFFAPGALPFGMGAALALGAAFLAVDLTYTAPIDELIASGRLDVAGPPGPDVVTRLRQRVAAELATERRRAETLADQRAAEQLSEMETEAEAGRRRLVAGLSLALKALADGDLTARVATPELRRDFEAAVALYGKTVFAFTSSTAAISSTVREIVAEAETLAAETVAAGAPIHAAREALTRAAQSSEAREREFDRALEAEARERAAADRLRAVVGDGAASLEHVAAERKRVNEIVERVGEVVFQMHLVAVNAGVEAARSGEAGRGFAVVAQELRALSQRSTEATAELTRAFASLGLDSAKRAASLREVLDEAEVAPDAAKPGAEAIGRSAGKLPRAAQRAIEGALRSATELAAKNERACATVGEASRSLDALVAKLAALASHFRMPEPESFAREAAPPEPVPAPLPSAARLPALRRLKVG